MRSFGGGGRASEWCGWKVLSRVCAEPNALRCSTAWRGEGEEAGQPPRTRTDIRTHSETCGPRAAAGTPSSPPLTRDAEGHPLSSRASVHGAAGARRDGGLQRLLVWDSAWQGDGVGRVKARVWLCAQSVRCAYVSIIDFFFVAGRRPRSSSPPSVPAPLSLSLHPPSHFRRPRQARPARPAQSPIVEFAIGTRKEEKKRITTSETRKKKRDFKRRPTRCIGATKTKTSLFLCTHHNGKT